MLELLFLLLLFFLALLPNPSVFVTELPAFVIVFAIEFVAPVIALIELLMAEVTEFVAVDAGGSSIAGIWGIVPLAM
jgi:hypothetical protein